MSNTFAVTLELENGDTISGKVTSMNDSEVVLMSEILGELKIKRELVESISPIEVRSGEGDSVDASLIHVDDENYMLELPNEDNMSVALDDIQEEDSKTFVQVENEDISAMAEKAYPPPTWSGQFDAGFNRRRGNTVNGEVNGSFTIRRKNEIEEFTLKGQGYYSERNRKMNSRKYKGSVRTAYSFGSEYKWYHFYEVEGDHDFFGNVRLRTIPYFGIGYWFSDEMPWKLMVEIAGGWEHTQFIDNSKDETQSIATPQLYSEIELFDGVILSEELVYYPSMEDRSKYRTYSETVIKIAVNDATTINFKLIDEFDSSPRGDTKKHDIRIISSIGYRFD